MVWQSGMAMKMDAEFRRGALRAEKMFYPQVMVFVQLALISDVLNSSIGDFI